MDESVVVPGLRDVHGSLSVPVGASSVVVACPPHPLHGGTRSDPRLVAVSDALAARGVACLRIEYGEWADGDGELGGVESAVAWAADRFERVGLFGYSFGGCLAAIAAGASDVDSLSMLAPAARLGPDLDAAAALADVSCSVQVVHGERDTTVDSTAVVEQVREIGGDVVPYATDHFFVGQHDDVAVVVASFTANAL